MTKGIRMVKKRKGENMKKSNSKNLSIREFEKLACKTSYRSRMNDVAYMLLDQQAALFLQVLRSIAKRLDQSEELRRMDQEIHRIRKALVELGQAE